MPTVAKLGAVVGALTAAVLLLQLVIFPVADIAQSNQTVTREHSTGVGTHVTGDLFATLDESHSGQNATLTFEDNETLETVTRTIDNGTTEGVTLAGVSFEATVTNATDSTAVVKYELARDAYLDSTAKAILPMLFTLLILLLLALVLGLGKDAIA